MAYSPEDKARIIEYVCTELAKGQRGVGTILSNDRESAKLCAEHTWYQWMREDGVSQQVARAREQGIDRNVEEMVEIADDKQEDAQSRKVRIYAREKKAQMLNPKKYGQRVDVTSGGEKLASPAPLVEAKINALITGIMGRKANSSELIDAKLIDQETRDLLE